MSAEGSAVPAVAVRSTATTDLPATGDTEAATRGPTRAERHRTARAAGPVDSWTILLAAIVAAQAVWLGILMSRGWYYQADFSNLAGATHRPLSLSYLTTSQGGHLGIVGAVVLWMLNRLAALNFAATIMLRLLFQAAATVLLARLLATLVGRRRGVLVVVALYAASPLLVQSTLWLTSSIGFLGGQLLILVAITAHLRYDAERRLRWAFGTAAALLGATLVTEQAAVTALVLPVLSGVFLSSGPASARLRALAACWREWLLIVVPVIAYAGFLLGSGRYHSSATSTPIGLSVAQALRAIGGELAHAVGPALMGGPFAWDSSNGNYFAFSVPPVAVQIGSAIFAVVLVAWSVRRTGWRALAAWLLPFGVATIGIVVVAIGRYHEFGDLVTRRMEYAAATAVPAAIGVCLAWWHTTPDEIRGRVLARTGAAPPPAAPAVARSARHRIARLAAPAVAVAVLVGSLASGVTYTRHWAQSPARSYVRNLEHDLTAAGPGVTVFDTVVDPSIIPGIEPNRHVSDLVGLMNIAVHFDQGPSAPRVVGPDGHLHAPSFVSSTAVVPPARNAFCGNLVSGSTDVQEDFAAPARENEWYLRLSYFQQHASVVDVWLVDRDGRQIAPFSGSSAVLADNLGRLYLRFPSAAPIGIRIRGGSAATNVCLVGATLGYPFAPQ